MIAIFNVSLDISNGHYPELPRSPPPAQYAPLTDVRPLAYTYTIPGYNTSLSSYKQFISSENYYNIAQKY